MHKIMVVAVETNDYSQDINLAIGYELSKLNQENFLSVSDEELKTIREAVVFYNKNLKYSSYKNIERGSILHIVHKINLYGVNEFLSFVDDNRKELEQKVAEEKKRKEKNEAEKKRNELERKRKQLEKLQKELGEVK